jgi:acyl transferase domain-containing protein/3-hydroxymyristoyl/3-hydroxydecanoyl-(acyl carrier protein) dehydratase/1-acyl-sn-glycerol-3-phosphate acyltransferase
MPFAPIAVVGRGCVLPGALDPQQLWLRIASGADLTGPASAARWGLDPARVCADPLEPAASARGGYVRGFDTVWDPGAYALPPEALQGLPEGWRWLMYAVAEALREAGIGLDGGRRTGLALGSLGYASREFAAAAAARWMEEGAGPHPALEGQTGALRWTAGACGIDGPRVALDAACASGLYALKTACDLLHARQADTVVAAGLNAADDLFLHVGFTALNALSPSGRSSPLSARADGLLPAEGVAALVLRRLDDAVAAGDPIWAVVRGVALSNDGRGPGLLAPTTGGQQRALRAAWASAGLDPATLAYLECHATGTPVGDTEEVRSLKAVFHQAPSLALGSLKAQMGHLITASATAGLLKLCGSFEAGVLPPAPRAALEAPLAELADGPFRLDPAVESWAPGDTARRAAINAFGFGGCNAHAILDGPEAAADLAAKAPRKRRDADQGAAQVSLAIVAADIAVGDAPDTSAVVATLAGERQATRRAGAVDLHLRGLGFPPADLRHALPQQLLLLRAVQRVAPALEGLDRTRLGVFIGADVDPAGARHGFRWRLEASLGRATTGAERNAVVPPLEAAGVLGTMPNMPANRLSSLVDAGGPGLVLSEGEASGRWALDRAADAIARGELDAALVGAVDASGAAFGDDPLRADAATLLLVMRVDKVGDHPVLARLRRDPDAAPGTPPWVPWADTGVAGDLVDVTVGALCAAHGMRPDAPWLPWVESERAWHVHGWTVEAVTPRGTAGEAPRATRYAAESLSGLVTRVRSGSPGGEGPWRLAGLGDPDAEALCAALSEVVEPPSSPREVARGWWLGHGAAGELAWVFTGAAAAYPGAGRALLRAFPGVGTSLAERAPRLVRELPRLQGDSPLSLVDQLQLATLVSQAHTAFLRSLGVRADACLGLSSGETNSYLASGAWTDADALFAAVEESGMYDLHLAGEHRTLRAARGLAPDDPADWCTFRVRHDVVALREAVAATEGGAPTDVVRLLIVHHGGDAVVGGTDGACRALLDRIGAAFTPLGHDLVVHCPELEPFADAWYAVHHRTTHPITSPRLYANALNGPFTPTAERCAENLLAQARDTAVFGDTVERAYQDGVRAFVELGPRAACAGWIGEILGERPHVACALDGTRGTLRDAGAALAKLAAAGVEVDLDAWNAAMDALLVTGDTKAAAAGAGMVTLPAYQPPSVSTAAPGVPYPRRPADALAPVLPELLRVVGPTTAVAGSATPVPAPASAPVLASVAALAETQAALLLAQELAVTALRNRAGHTRPAAVPSVRASTTVPENVTPTIPPMVYPGPSFTRDQLEYLAHGRISTLFGPSFERQDAWHRQVRMPMPPLLLADRVMGIEGEAATMGTGRIWTETDVPPDAWYLHRGRMPVGIMIESGQADLLLISWLGIDLTHPGNRVYRLLGCELTFTGPLPAVGDTLKYDIRITGHARHGEIGLFFFHYDCTIGGTTRLQVRDGQAGLFSDEELAESAGVLWEPMEDVPDPDAPLAGPRMGMEVRRSYSADQVAAFARGDAYAAFGEGARRTASHTRTPTIPAGDMMLFTEVVDMDPDGGPWGRGYMKAVLPVTPDLWFFDGHFHNDPCMPGTLMFDGALQAMAFYLAAMGFTVDRDGWAFEPVRETAYKLRCRGQCTPTNRELVYEVFVAEVHGGARPRLVADLLCTVDGLKAFHCRRMALELTPDHPLSNAELAKVEDREGAVAEHEGFRYGQASLLACANGHPESAFGALYASVPEGARVPRLPAPPYLFMSRVASLDAPPGQMKAGVTVESVYDLPPDAWYFRDHPSGDMPVCVLVEVALQPCGWLASYVGCAVQEKGETFFRNLDGKGTVHRPVRAVDGSVRVRSKLTSLSRAGGMTLVSFAVECSVGDEVVYDLTTTFGFFPEAALAGQAGLPTQADDAALVARAGGADLLDGLDAAGSAALPAPMLRMCDRVTVRDVDATGRAVLLGEKTVHPDEWFFKSHFYRDPVQPGSLGVEALVQLVQAHLLLGGAATALPGGGFRDLVADEPCAWQFRGQVLPESQAVALTVTCEPVERGADGWTVRASGSVWVDGRRIYHVNGIRVTWAAGPAPSGAIVLDAAEQPWWQDHCPTYTIPVAPGMASLALVVEHGGTEGLQVTGVRDLSLFRWLALDRPRTLRVERSGDRVRLVEEGPEGGLVAEGAVVVGHFPPSPSPVPPLPTDAPALDDPYASGALFHGPSYHRLVRAVRTSGGADAVLRLDAVADGREPVSHIVLDAALHAVPHDDMGIWFDGVAAGQVAYPARIERFTLHRAPPRSGTTEARIRPAGLAGGNPRFPRIHVQLLDGGAVWAEMVVVEICLPATRLGALPGPERRRFLRDGAFVAGARLSVERDGVSALTPGAAAEADWLPGTVAAVYGVHESDPASLVAAVAAREHAGHRLEIHPRDIRVDAEGRITSPLLPYLDYRVAVAKTGKEVRVRDAAGPALAVDRAADWWRDRGWQSERPELHDLFMRACARFVRGVRVADPEALAGLGGKPILLVANHQVAVESLLAGMLLPPLVGRPLLTLAKSEHQRTWVGQLAVGLNDPAHGEGVAFVDRTRQEEMFQRLTEMGQAAHSGERALLVHVEGTRALRGGEPVRTISAAWFDLAVRFGLVIVPLRFCRGLPVAGVANRADFPVGFGGQDFVVGRPIESSDLADLRLDERRSRVLAGLGELEAFDGDPVPDRAFEGRAAAAAARWKVDDLRATFLLLKAEVEGWPLADDGLPVELPAADGTDAFWSWFMGVEGGAAITGGRERPE